MKPNQTIMVTGKYITQWLLIVVYSCMSMMFSIQVNAQSQITLKGTVLDKQTNEPMPFATITILQSKISVVTNEMGEFQFHIPEESKNNVVQISYLGYKTIKLKVNDLKPGMETTFRMESQVQQLKEVEIKEKKSKTAAEDIVNRAVRSIRKNFPKDKTLYYGYYRDYISPAWTVSYQNLIEAALVMEDRGFQSHDFDRTKIKLEQLRYNPAISIDSSLNFAYDGKNKYIPYATMGIAIANELAILKAHDPIRNHKSKSFSFIDVFDYNFVENHHFEYEAISEEDSMLIYCIRFNRYDKITVSNSEYIVNGQIFIRSDNYAILKFNYTITCNTPTYTGKFLDLKLEYKNYNDKYFLNYLSLMNCFVLKNTPSSNHLNTPYHQYRELFINKIVNEPFVSLQTKETINKRASLLTNKIPVIDGFWDHYNYTGIPKLEKQVVTEY